MKRTLFTTLLILFFVSTLYLPLANSDSVNLLRRTDDISRSKAAFAVVDEAIARGLNLHTLSESDSWKLRGPVLLDPQTDIHFQLREEFDRIVNTVDFRASLDTGSPSQNLPVRQDNTPVLHQKAAELIRAFIAQKHISLIIMSDAPIGMGEIAAIRGLQGAVRYTYEIINSACVIIPIKNLAGLIRQPFITEIWPDSKGNLQLSQSVQDIGADKVHNAPPNGLGVTGKGVTVAVVDTGIASDHPEFRGRIKDTRGIVVNRALDHDEIHGTHVAGIIGAAANGNNITGVAPEVDFLDATSEPLGSMIPNQLHRFFNSERIGYSGAMDTIGWAAKKHNLFNANTKADIINMSIGWYPWIYGREGTDPMSKLIDELIDDGIVFVVSAGNKAKERASATLPANTNYVDHKFSVSVGTFDVTLVQDNGDPDLDLVILDFDGNKFCASHTGGFWSSIRNIGLNPWRGTVVSETEYGKVYKKVKCNEPGNASDFTVRVQRDNGNTANIDQDYEVWLSDGVEFKSLPPEYNPEDTITVPGYSKKVITVGNLAGGTLNTIYNTSSQGPNIPNQPLKPEVVAPGVRINSTVPNGGYDIKSGTSMAAPHVAGVAALILDAVGKDKNGDWNFSPDEVKSAIVRGAERGIGDIPNIPDNIYGAGLVKADNIIFGGTVQPGGKLRFRITPRLVRNRYNQLDLDAINVFAAAISWDSWEDSTPRPTPGTTTTTTTTIPPANSKDLDLEFSNLSTVSWVTEEGSNSEKITAFVHSGFYHLDVIHKDPNGEPIRFTGASIHPIHPVPHAPVLRNLVAYYPFDGDAEDASGNGNHGQGTGSINYVEGKFGKALELSNGEYIEMEATDTLHGDIFKAEPFTLSAWIYPKPETRYGHVWRSNPVGAGHNTLFIIGDEGGISWRARINGAWSWDDLCETEPGIVKANQWIHVAVTNDGAKFRIYANGEVVAETNFKQTDGGNTTYSIGSRYTSGETFAGWIDDYAIFSSALSEDEIKRIIQVGVKQFIDSPEAVVLATDSHTRETAADVNEDGEVNIQDLVAVNSALLTEASGNNADVNQDGIINIADLILVAAAIATSEAAVAAAPAVIADQAAKPLTPADVQQWLIQARQLDLTDPKAQRGILFLEQLLAALTPKETALLPNYPNPFNPETWIPYQLAKPAAVTLTIYDIKGHVVRNLDLGHQRAGIYHGKSRAVYWDGKNEIGESVASGLYFYTLTAGDFTATRKMLILK